MVGRSVVLETRLPNCYDIEACHLDRRPANSEPKWRNLRVNRPWRTVILDARFSPAFQARPRNSSEFCLLYSEFCSLPKDQISIRMPHAVTIMNVGHFRENSPLRPAELPVPLLCGR